MSAYITRYGIKIGGYCNKFSGSAVIEDKALEHRDWVAFDVASSSAVYSMMKRNRLVDRVYNCGYRIRLGHYLCLLDEDLLLEKEYKLSYLFFFPDRVEAITKQYKFILPPLNYIYEDSGSYCFIVGYDEDGGAGICSVADESSNHILFY